jgi:hypothetical protein
MVHGGSTSAQRLVLLRHLPAHGRDAIAARLTLSSSRSRSSQLLGRHRWGSSSLMRLFG